MLFRSGGDLFFRAVTSQVSWAPKSLTTVFGMGTGVASWSYPPEWLRMRKAPSKPHRGRRAVSDKTGIEPVKGGNGTFHICKNQNQKGLRSNVLWSSPRPISTGPLTCCHAYTPGLSTMWSTWGLTISEGNLILRRVSHLDAFSVYPIRT